MAVDWSKFNEEFFSEDAIGRRLKQRAAIDTAAKAQLEGTFGQKTDAKRMLEGTFGQKTAADQALARITGAPEMMKAQFETDPKRFREKTMLARIQNAPEMRKARFLSDPARHREAIELQNLENFPSLVSAENQGNYYNFLASDMNPDARRVSLEESVFDYEKAQDEIATANKKKKEAAAAAAVATPSQAVSTPAVPAPDFVDRRSPGVREVMDSILPPTLSKAWQGWGDSLEDWVKDSKVDPWSYGGKRIWDEVQ